MAEWVADDLPLIGSQASSDADGTSYRSPSSVASQGSTVYMPPGKRRQLENLRATLKVTTAEADVVDQRIRVAEGSKSLGRLQHGKLPSFSLPFFLNSAQMRLLTQRFPRTEFGCSADNAHDHPLAHTETMIAVSKALRLAPAGSFVVDLYGSPRDMDNFRRSQARSDRPKSGIAYVGLKTEKDFLRSLKWGESRSGDVLRYIEDADGPVIDLGVTKAGLQNVGTEVIPGNNLVYFCKHTMYYLSDEQICELLSPNGSRMISIIHRHAKSSGDLFGGECTYGKVGNAVEQVNTLTGERYVHRDLSFLWDSKSKVVRTCKGAYTWTFHMVSVDTWIIELTACPVRMDERFRSREAVLGLVGACDEMNTHALVPTSFPHPSLAALPSASCVMVGGVPLIKFDGGALPDCQLTCPDLFNFLATNMVGKPRDADRLDDLFSLARTHVANGQEFPGKRNFDVAYHEIAAHVILAYVSGLSRETELLRAVAGYRVWAKEHVALKDGVALTATTAPQSALGSVVFAAQRVNAARKRTDTFDAILGLVD